MHPASGARNNRSASIVNRAHDLCKLFVTPRMAMSGSDRLAPPATPQPILSKLSSACAEAAENDLYATTAKRVEQPDDYYADAAAFRQRLARDIESKARVLSRLKTQ